MPTTTATYRIPADNFPTLKDTIDRANKKVEKLKKKGYDVQPVEVKIGKTEIEKYFVLNRVTGQRVERERIWMNIELLTQVTSVQGWEFIATLQHEGEGTIVRAVPGMTQEGELVQFRESKPLCQHCGYERKRNDTFVLRKVE